MIIFRVDSSTRIGNGHLMRCRTLAEALQKRGEEVEFICRRHEGDMLELLQKSFTVHELPAPAATTSKASDGDYPAWLGVAQEDDAVETIKALRARPDWLIIDHYSLDTIWETALRPYAKRIMVIDDLADRNHDCDLLLDQNLVANLEQRYSGRVAPHCPLLIGPHYALLQPQYAELHPRTPPRMGPVERILIYFGGSDQHNLTGLALSAFLNLLRSDITVDIVIDEQSTYAEAIQRQAKYHPNITVHGTLPSLAPLMLSADLAIGAGGATSWERCCLGLPTLVITLADNQIPIAEALNQQGLVRWLGHHNTVKEPALTEILQEVLTTSELEQWSHACLNMVDGKGVGRVVAAIKLNDDTPLKTRLARLDDEALLLQWSNDHLVCQNSSNSDKIAKETHRNWFYAKLRKPEQCRIYIVETDEGLPIGQVRFECHCTKWEIHCELNSITSDRKIGNKVLEKAIYDFHLSNSTAVFSYCINHENLWSKSFFEELGLAIPTGSGLNLSLAVCSDPNSWINEYIAEQILQWLAAGHECCWTHNADNLPGGTLCFYLSYGRIVGRKIRAKYRYNLVVHASDLPMGRGWSPASWMVLEGKKRIPATLLEAVDDVDSGPIYDQIWIELDSSDLVDDWRKKLAIATGELAMRFIEGYPKTTTQKRNQVGEATYYPERHPSDSQLDINKSIAQQFNLLRIVDNDNYPAFFVLDNNEYILKICKKNSTDQ
jgi:UDP-2,4-diacetamido-2,4,6-trideoxy-beta-L-altropyranose hydrolase